MGYKVTRQFKGHIQRVFSFNLRKVYSHTVILNIGMNGYELLLD